MFLEKLIKILWNIKFLFFPYNNDNNDDDNDVLFVVITGPGKIQIFVVYIYIIKNINN